MDICVSLAKQAIESYVRFRRVISVPQDLPEEFYSRRAGVFVTLKIMGQLRGCIGTYAPTRQNIAEEIIHNAIAACANDPRFMPVVPDELPELTYEVSILNQPCELHDPERHDPRYYGLIVKASGGRCGLLLPDIEGVNTFEEQLSIACQKGGIDPQKDKPVLYYFTVEKHK